MEREMMIFEIRNKDGVTVAVEEDFGNAAVHEMIHKIDPYLSAINLPALFDTLLHTCKPIKALTINGIGANTAIPVGTFKTSST